MLISIFFSVVEHEAMTAVKMALKLKQMNKMDKAQKLFQHALVLSPNHHDVLLHYGEFLESGKDFINADHFYLKAVAIRPTSSRALAHRKRTLPVVNQLDLEELKRIESKRAELIQLNKKDPALNRLKKEIYFQHIYHTVAIEGNTMSLSETRAIIETKLAVPGKSILEHNEILGLDSALRYLNQTLANKNGDIYVSDILELHKRVMGHVDPMTAGTFRKTQVFVGRHVPPAASDVELLMEEFVRVLRSPTIRKMHPVHIAAFAHHKLVFIHPFLDGNGRTSRLLMNLIFLKYGYPPIIIRKEERAQYFKLLQIAHEEDHRPFYRFIARAAEYTIDAFLQAYEYKQPVLKVLESTNDPTDLIAL